MTTHPTKGTILHRAILSDAQVSTDDANTINLSVSSDIPYQREFGYEVLSHEPSAVDLTRFQNSAAVLVDHSGDQIGVVDRAWLDSNKLRVAIRFSQNAYAQSVLQDVKDGIRKNVSIGYLPLKWDNPKERQLLNDVPVYTATKWQPFEMSFVSVPADYSVGVGRSMEELKSDKIKLSAAQYAALKDLMDNSEPEDEPEDVPDDDNVADAIVAAVAEEVIETITEALITDNSSDEDDEEEEEAGEESADEAPAAPTTTKSATQSATPIVTEISRMKDNTEDVVNPAVNISLTAKEHKEYSLARAILTLCDPKAKRDGFEFDVSQEIEKTRGASPDGMGFYMPTTLNALSPQTRGYIDIGDSSTGQNLVFTQPGQFVDYLRNRAVVAGLGATVMDLPSKVALPRMSADVSASWIGEDATAATLAVPTFDQVTISPKKLGIVTGWSLETLRIANYDIESLMRDNIYNKFATAFDQAAIQGSGTGGQPTGILNVTGLVSGSQASGSALTYASAVECWSKVAQSNADLGTLAYLTTPQVAQSASTTIRSGSTTTFIMTDDKKIYGYPVGVSNNVPTSAGHYLIYGDFSALILASFGAIELIVDPYSSKGKGVVELSGMLLGDVEIKTLKSFAIQKNILA